MNRYRHRFRLTVTLSCIMLLAACATAPVDSLHRQTGDLGQVVDDAERMAERLGASGVLVVFDIDNTLLAMEQGLGSDQWYEWQKRAAEQDPCDERVVADRLAVQGALYFASAMRPTQADAARLVRRLQDGGFSVIALTSRGVDFRLQTFRELRRNGFDFRRGAIGPDGGWPEDFLPERGIRPVRYEDGVFLTTGQHKGEMLLELVRRADTDLPGAVVMVDDKSANLDAVRESLARLDVPVRTWRFIGEDANVSAFDADRSHAEWQRLRPALETVQDVLGEDHYSLPAETVHPGCRDPG